MLAQKTELNHYIAALAQRAFTSGSELTQLRWSWLLQPSSASVLKLIAKLDSEKTTPTATVTSLDNTLLWVSLFDSAFTHRKFSHSLSALSEKIDCEETRLENQLVRYFIADRNKDEKLALSTLSGLQKSLKNVASDQILPAANALLESIEKLDPSKRKLLSSKITVNLGHWEIQAHGKKFISRPLCLFIELLKANLSISFDELLAVAFDIPKYDESFHHQKIQNLVSRLRVLSPDFVVRTRQGRIYSEISWDQVLVQSMSAHQESLKKSGILGLFLTSEQRKEVVEKSALRVSVSKLKSALLSDFSRTDFEKATGFPRSTASRFLKNWLTQDILVRSGAGKATVYNFKLAP